MECVQNVGECVRILQLLQDSAGLLITNPSEFDVRFLGGLHLNPEVPTRRALFPIRVPVATFVCEG